MVEQLVAGTLYGKAVHRIGDDGKAFVTATVRSFTNERERLFVTVITFVDAAKAALLELDDGDAVALVGEFTTGAWLDEHGVGRPALDLVANAVLTAGTNRRKRKAATAKVVAGSTSITATRASPPRRDPPQVPFHTVEEAKENAVLLSRAFRFCSLRYADDGGFPNPERTRDVMAQAFGCLNWSDLASSIDGGSPGPYFDSIPAEASWGTPAAYAEHVHRELTPSLLVLLVYVDEGAKSQMASLYRTYESNEHRIQAALKYSAFGCSPQMRKKAEASLNSMPYRTVDQWSRLQLLERGRSNVTRYAKGWRSDRRKAFGAAPRI
ncbi:hypothetical protein KDW62_26560 [Burkholderia multivorans]|uniref:single-stranded DNA-binding protein n=1 Tax=Burkholderia multivorans TaxID=87883 RepID=UPI001BA00618|nr:hypothetical protein [Burkholderia multivorans]MBR8048735.1 hypothetical protein [Burkholderia multivorans]